MGHFNTTLDEVTPVKTAAKHDCGLVFEKEREFCQNIFKFYKTANKRELNAFFRDKF
jgi:hypothetical protein